MNAHLHPAGALDVPLIAELMAAAFDKRFGEAWSGAQVAGALAIGDTFAQLARISGEAVGFSLTRRLLDEAELMLVAVTPAARGAGIGRLLLDGAMGEAQRRGASRMFLEVRANNDGAMALYKAAGFEAVGRRSNYYRGATGERFDAITFARDLG
jgi:ribosomal-protein-alanine N-acetyltransferase